MNVVFTTVVRATGPEEAHGGLFFTDLATGRTVHALDWDLGVDTKTRGGARGLRGVLWHRDRLWVATWDSVLEFDVGLELRGVHRHRALLHTHQLAAWGDRVLVVSTAFDSVLALDTVSGSFDWGLLVRGHPDDPVVQTFHPDDPPERGDSTHLNMVHAIDGKLSVSGTRMRVLVLLEGSTASVGAGLPFGTHDARQTASRVLYSDTERDRVVWGEVAMGVPRVHPGRLTHLESADGMARQAFARGLLQIDPTTAIGGASPASLHRYDRATGAVTTVCRVTHDVRAAVHGLALWPHPIPTLELRSARTLHAQSSRGLHYQL